MSFVQTPARKIPERALTMNPKGIKSALSAQDLGNLKYRLGEDIAAFKPVVLTNGKLYKSTTFAEYITTRAGVSGDLVEVIRVGRLNYRFRTTDGNVFVNGSNLSETPGTVFQQIGYQIGNVLEVNIGIYYV